MVRGPDHDGGIYTAVHAWCGDPAAAKARYGPIASWDISEVTRMNSLFYYKLYFNEDISRWNVSNVVDLGATFRGATSFNGDLSRWDVGQVQRMGSTFAGAASFNGDISGWDVGQVESMGSMFQDTASFDRQLGGAWATSTGGATKAWMFLNSPGSIAGKTKDAHGTIA